MMQDNPSPLRQIAKYAVEGILGSGAMGVVYKAQHINPSVAQRQGGVIALKVLHERYAMNRNYQERFEREATLVLNLHHPGVVQVHDLVIDKGQLAMAMAPGRSGGSVPAGPLHALADGIAEAHRA